MSSASDERCSVDARADVSELDDRDLVDRLNQCQLGAMAELYERHSARVHALATDIWGSSLADHVVQDVFTQLWQTPTSYDADRGSVGVHLSMQVRLWEAPAHEPERDPHLRDLPTGEQRPRRSGLGQLRRQLTDRAPFGSRDTRTDGH